MPIGATGMDTPSYSGKMAPYDVMLTAKNDSARVYQHYQENNLWEPLLPSSSPSPAP